MFTSFSPSLSRSPPHHPPTHPPTHTHPQINEGTFHYTSGPGQRAGISATPHGVPLATPAPMSVPLRPQSRSRSPSPERPLGEKKHPGVRRPTTAVERPTYAQSTALGPVKSLRFAPGPGAGVWTGVGTGVGVGVGTGFGPGLGAGGTGPRPASALPTTGQRASPFRPSAVLAIPPGLRTAQPLDLADSLVGVMPARKAPFSANLLKQPKVVLDVMGRNIEDFGVADFRSRKTFHGDALGPLHPANQPTGMVYGQGGTGGTGVMGGTGGTYGSAMSMGPNTDNFVGNTTTERRK